jgi:hypothetical protein
LNFIGTKFRARGEGHVCARNYSLGYEPVILNASIRRFFLGVAPPRVVNA